MQKGRHYNEQCIREHKSNLCRNRCTSRASGELNNFNSCKRSKATYLHKDTNSFCAYDRNEDKLFAEHKSFSKFENTIHYLRNLQKTVGSE